MNGRDATAREMTERDRIAKRGQSIRKQVSCTGSRRGEEEIREAEARAGAGGSNKSGGKTD
jgi:hypothetical protein